MQLQQPTPKFIRTVFDVETIQNNERQRVSNVGCKTLSEAREIAAKRSRSSGLPVVELTWRQDIKDQTGDCIVIAEIRQDCAREGWPRVFE
jgi:hypothetical protein